VTTGRRKPVRVRRARYASLCPLCGGPITVRQQVAAYSFSKWAHIYCHLKAREADSDGGDGDQ